jgi:hypothetical protein
VGVQGPFLPPNGIRKPFPVPGHFDDFTGLYSELLLQKVRETHFSDETQPLGIFFGRRWDSPLLGHPPDVGFQNFPNRKKGFLELGLV